MRSLPEEMERFSVSAIWARFLKQRLDVAHGAFKCMTYFPTGEQSRLTLIKRMSIVVVGPIRLRVTFSSVLLMIRF